MDFTSEQIEFFWSKVDTTSPGCWEWPGARSSRTDPLQAYGRISLARKRGHTIGAHRMSAALAGLDIEGVLVRHRCDNPPCVRPSHLSTGSHVDNTRDMLERGRNKPTRKLTDAQVLEARTLRTQGWLAKDLANKCGVAQTTMFAILRNDVYKHVSWVNEEYEEGRRTKYVKGHPWAEFGVQRSKQMFCTLCDREYKREWSRRARRRAKGLPETDTTDYRRKKPS